jgi:hypothetical protein
VRVICAASTLAPALLLCVQGGDDRPDAAVTQGVEPADRAADEATAKSEVTAALVAALA